MGWDLVEALYYLHSHSIICVDLKPENVLVNEFGMLKLGDFGCSIKLAEISKTKKSDVNSNPNCMAPELFTDSGVFSFASDIWALGTLIYEMATGKQPFPASWL